jgi:hypothetical protein
MTIAASPSNPWTSLTTARALDEDIDVDIPGAFATIGELAAWRRPGSAMWHDIDFKFQRIDRLQHKTDLGAGLAMLDFNDPLSTDADSIGELLLIEAQMSPLLANHPADVICVHGVHRAPLSSYADIVLCRRSTTSNLSSFDDTTNVVVRRQQQRA